MIGICFHHSSPLDLWKRLGTERVEKAKVAQLAKAKTKDLIIMNNRWPNSIVEKELLMKIRQLYASSVYSLSVALCIKFYSLFFLGKNIPISLRLGYMPDILHFRNKKYYSAIKAVILIILALIFCKNIFAINTFKRHWLLNSGRKITWVDQIVSKDTVHKAPKEFNRRKIDFLFCGRLEEEKGIKTLLNLNFRKMNIFVVGDGKYSA